MRITHPGCLATPQLVGIIYYLPAGLIGGLGGFLVKEQINSQQKNWANYLPHAGTFFGTFLAGIIGAIVFNWTNWLGGMTMSFIYACIIPVGALLFYYGFSGDKPRIFHLIFE